MAANIDTSASYENEEYRNVIPSTLPISEPGSSSQSLDERTPLLSASETLVGRRKKKREVERTPLPLVQIGVLLFLQLSEPVTSQAIYPFINEVRRTCVYSFVLKYIIDT